MAYNVTQINRRFYNVSQSATSGFNTTYQTIYDAMTNKPPSNVANAQNILVSTLISTGIWSKLDVLYVLAQYSNDASEALINWINPGMFNAALAGTPNPTFVSLEGFTSDGTNGYINTGWNPSSDGVNYLQNNASFGCYVRSNIAEQKFDMGINDGSTYAQMISRSIANATNSRIHNSNQDMPGANSDGRGLFVVSRTANNARATYKNGELLANDTQAALAIPNLDLYLLGLNLSGTANYITTRQMSIAFAGSGMNQTEAGNFYNAVETYMDAIDSGAVPNDKMTILGDSISDDPTTMWVLEIPENEYVVNNFADRGDSIMVDMANQVTAANGTETTIVICFLGTNDNEAGDMGALQAEVESNLEQLAADHPTAVIYYVNVLPRWTNGGGAVIVDKTNIRAAILAACTAKGVECWDTFTTPWITSDDTDDGVHPNQSGSEKIWNEISLRL